MRLSAGSLARGGGLVALGFCPVLIHLAVVGEGGSRLASAPAVGRAVDLGLVAATALPHTVIYATLLAVFGATLLPGRDALVTALSRRMYDSVPPAMAAYTRGVTWAWCGFFAAQLATSLALFLWAPVAVWSVFVNLLDLPLIALMFAAEHACRLVCLADAPRHSPADVVRMIGYIRDGVWKRSRPG
ncbi:MAG TPA: hypothetical protein VEI03_20395 [Stellaceae bacterium]|nr:hypothetical protein [Stellaceae bacterium]